jgi:hypothetical protein
VHLLSAGFLVVYVAGLVVLWEGEQTTLSSFARRR